MKKSKKKVLSDEEIAKYWEKNDLTEVMNMDKATLEEMIYQPPVQTISLRLPLPLIITIKQIAAKMDIAYQALIKIWLADKARSEIKSS